MQEENKLIAECRVRYLSFLGIGRNVKQCGFIMHTAQDLFIAHVFHCEPSSGALCKTVEAACKVSILKTDWLVNGSFLSSQSLVLYSRKFLAVAPFWANSDYYESLQLFLKDILSSCVHHGLRVCWSRFNSVCSHHRQGFYVFHHGCWASTSPHTGLILKALSVRIKWMTSAVCVTWHFRVRNIHMPTHLSLQGQFLK